METNIIKWDAKMAKRCFSRLQSYDYWKSNMFFDSIAAKKGAKKKGSENKDDDGWAHFRNSIK